MLSCAEFADRVYDEDCRRALQGAADVPRDVARHRGTCAACAQAWLEAADDLALVQGAVGPAPASLERRIRTRLAEEPLRTPWPAWSRRVAWWSVAGVAAALAAAHAVPSLADAGPFLLALCGGSLAFAASTLNEALRRRM